MKRDFNTVLKDIEGRPLRAAEDRLLTLGEAVANALLATYEDDSKASGEDKLRRYQLAQRVYQSGSVEVTAEEVALMKTFLARCYGPVVVGPAYEALEG